MIPPELAFLFLGVVGKSDFLNSTIDYIIPMYTACAGYVLYLVYVDHINNKSSGQDNGGSAVAVAIPSPSSPSNSTASTTSTSPSKLSSSKKQDPDPTHYPPSVDLSGTWNLSKNEKYQEFLQVQGVGYVLRKAADSANTVHEIKHGGDSFFIGIKSLLSSEMTYTVNGDPITTAIKDKSFLDTVTYLEDGRGIQIVKHNAKDKYYIIAKRRLGADGQTMTVEQECRFEDKKKKGATAIQVFTRA
jgi:hypothetical protein